ncbi:MAG TPA: hypothetical protein VIY48_00565 [Candidatus Paceibacterota bacterium]
MFANLYNYIRTRQPDGSGTGIYAFLPEFTLPLVTLPGPATPVPQFWSAVQPEQLYYNQAQRYDGKAGVVAGQMALQALIDNRGITG